MRAEIKRIRHYRRYLLVLFVVATLMAGCGKWSHNGHLDGQWQVMEVTYNGVPVDFPEDGSRYYYDFYLSTLQLSMTGYRPDRLKANMAYDENKSVLSLDFAFIKEHMVPKQWMDRLVYWGVPKSGEMIVSIKELTSSRLVMEYPGVVIVCRKF